MDKDRVKSPTGKPSGQGEQASSGLMGDVKAQAEGLYDQAAGAAQSAYGAAKETVRGVAEDAPRYVDEALEQGQRYYEEGRRYLDEGNRVVARQVGDQQLAALVIAGALGYLLGWLFHGRR